MKNTLIIGLDFPTKTIKTTSLATSVVQKPKMNYLFTTLVKAYILIAKLLDKTISGELLIK